MGHTIREAGESQGIDIKKKKKVFPGESKVQPGHRTRQVFWTIAYWRQRSCFSCLPLYPLATQIFVERIIRLTPWSPGQSVGCHWWLGRWGPIYWAPGPHFYLLILKYILPGRIWKLVIYWSSLVVLDKCVLWSVVPTLCDPMDCNPPGSSVHGIFQARIFGAGCRTKEQGKFLLMQQDGLRTSSLMIKFQHIFIKRNNLIKHLWSSVQH